MDETRTWKRTLSVLVMLPLALGTLSRSGSGAEVTRFLVSYGGTAGYQLPLWVNKDMGCSKKYGVNKEIILIQEGSPKLRLLLDCSSQLTKTDASTAALS